MLESLVLEVLAQPEALLALATSGHRELLRREGTTRTPSWRNSANVQGVTTLEGQSDGSHCATKDSVNP